MVEKSKSKFFVFWKWLLELIKGTFEKNISYETYFGGKLDSHSSQEHTISSICITYILKIRLLNKLNEGELL